MTGGIAGCFFLGCLFLYLAARRHRRSARWRGAVRLPAVVSSVRYQEAWSRKAEIDDRASSTEVTICFTDQGRRYEESRRFPGLLGTPAQGQKIPILFQRDSGDWILRKEAHTHWRLFLVLGCLCVTAGLLLLLDGPGILSDLTDYHVDAPNLPGSVICALIGLLCGTCAYACVRGLLPDLMRSAAEPFVWMVQFHLLHRYEEMDALCIGIIRRVSGDDDVCYYPFFQYSVEGAQSRWFPRRQMSRKRYQPGNWYTLYRDPGTGRCALKPSAWDLTSALLSLIPLGFFVLLVLSLAVCAVGSLWIAALGFAQILAV